MLLGHMVCKEGLCVNPVKFVVIVNMDPLAGVKQLRSTFAHTRYYKRFI